MVKKINIKMKSIPKFTNFIENKKYLQVIERTIDYISYCYMLWLYHKLYWRVISWTCLPVTRSNTYLLTRRVKKQNLSYEMGFDLWDEPPKILRWKYFSTCDKQFDKKIDRADIQTAINFIFRCRILHDGEWATNSFIPVACMTG